MSPRRPGYESKNPRVDVVHADSVADHETKLLERGTHRHVTLLLHFVKSIARLAEEVDEVPSRAQHICYKSETIGIAGEREREAYPFMKNGPWHGQA